MPREAGRARTGVALIATRYELVRELRVDAESVFWEAFDAALDRPVVIQLLRPDLAGDPAATERFRQYTRAVARRPARVGERILDGGTDPESGQLFVVREWAARPLGAQGRLIGLLDRSLPMALLDRLQPHLQLQERPRWVVLTALAVALIILGAAIKPGVERWLAWVNEPAGQVGPGLNLAPAAVVPASGAQPGPGGSPAGAGSGATVEPAATQAPTLAETATPVSGAARKIVNTDGRGVALRGAPGGDRLPGKGYDEGVTVEAFEQNGEWTRIRGSDGREGWVLTVTLAPAR